MRNMHTALPNSQRRFGCLRGNVITLEGLIGVGKTTLGKTLTSYLTQQGFQAQFFPEYVNTVFLTRYINDMNRYAFAFQIFMLQKRFEIYREAAAFARTGGIAIIDRSVVGDYAFALMQREKGNFTEEEWETYLEILQAEKIPEPSITLFLACPPKVALARIAKRGITAEIEGYQVAYLSELLEAYRKSLERIAHPIVTLTWSGIGEEPEKVLDIIREKLYG